MTKVKTSIYVDRELWDRFRRYALKRGKEVSQILEESINESIIDEDLFSEMVDYTDYEIDFEPVKPRQGIVSDLVRVMRDGRSGNISRQ
ncbi:hypothetical protein L3N51_01311 [Metallosphaera sp. J1]|nr:hypothetical protein [Metallosphaera javensis (ex Hofmann et al. 2022)]